MANNRELSQFASFVEVGISSIGFTTSVGIGKTNPQFNLDVAGDINFTGTFYQGGTQFIASRWSATGSDIYRLSKVGINTSIVSSALTVNGDVSVSGVVTATTFIGAVTGTASSTTNIPNLTGDITSVNSVTSIAAGVIIDADINASAAIVDTKLATIATALKVSNSATTATSANTNNAIVARDASGNFSAGTITASLTGTATSTTNIPNLTGDITSVNSVTSIAAGVIIDADINASAAIAVSKLAASTISGIALGNNLNVLTISTGLSGSSYNGSGAVTIAIDSTVATLTGTQTLTNKTLTSPTLGGTINIGTDVGISTTRTTVATTAVTTIDSFATATFRSTRAQVQITQSTNYQASDVLIIHDGTTASIVEYGSIATNDYLGTFSASVSGGNCLLGINMSSATSATVKVLSQRITV